MVMFTLLLVGEAPGSEPVKFRAVDAETGDPISDVVVWQLPPTWQVHVLFFSPKKRWVPATQSTDEAGEVAFDETSRCTYFFEVGGYVPVDVRKGWFGRKAYEEPYKHDASVKEVDGVWVVPLRPRKGER
jgi:hypothetical protein